MHVFKRIWIIIKTSFKGWVRYPENVAGILLYIFVVIFVGYAYTHGTLQDLSLPYYAIGLFIYLLIGQQNAVFLEFSIWKDDILSKHVNKDIFLTGSFFGALISNIIPALVLIALAYIFGMNYFNASFMIIPVTFLGILCALGVSYWFACLGLRLGRRGTISTAVTFILTVFSGIAIPISIIPQWMKYISYSIPYTWVVDLTRHYFLGTPCILDPNQEFVYLVLSTMVIMVGGKLSLEYMALKIKHRKVIVR